MNEPPERLMPAREAAHPLLFALPPLLVWTLSLAVFEALAFDLDAVTLQLAEVLSARKADAPLPRAEETAVRLLWAASLLLFTFVATAMLVYAVSLFVVRRTRPGARMFVAVAAIAGLTSLGYQALSSAQRSAFSMIYHFTHDGLHACGCYDAAELGLVDAAVTGLNVLAAVVPAVALIAACSGLALPRGRDRAALDAIERRMAGLKTMVAAGSALLVTGLIHQTLWQRWPVVLASGDSGLLAFVESMSIYWGVSYSLLIVAFYVPPAWAMSRRARAILESDPTLVQGTDVDGWLTEHGLSRRSLQHLPQIAAVLAPLLAGPLGASLAGVGGAVVPG